MDGQICTLIATDYDTETEPTSFQEAVEDPEHSKQWITAMNDEYDSLIKNDVWELVPRPKDHNVVISKWVFKIKSSSYFKA